MTQQSNRTLNQTLQRCEHAESTFIPSAGKLDSVRVMSAFESDNADDRTLQSPEQYLGV